MAKRLDDTEDRPPQDRYPAGRHPEVEAAEFEAEQPARDLTGLPRLVISVAAVAVSLYALFWVVRPQPAQPYRTSFLAVTLAMTLLAYRPLARGGKATEEERAAGGDTRGRSTGPWPPWPWSPSSPRCWCSTTSPAGSSGPPGWTWSLGWSRSCWCWRRQGGPSVGC